MSTFKKLLLIFSTAIIATQSDAMWLRRPLMVALAKRSAVMRTPAVKTAARTRSVPTNEVVRQVRPRQSLAFKSYKTYSFPSRLNLLRSFFALKPAFMRYVMPGTALVSGLYVSNNKSAYADSKAPDIITRIFHGDLEYVKSFVARYKNDLNNKYTFKINENGYIDTTALLYAIHTNKVDIALYLIKAGAEIPINMLSIGFAPALDFAILHDSEALIEALLQKNPDFTAVNYKGNTIYEEARKAYSSGQLSQKSFELIKKHVPKALMADTLTSIAGEIPKEVSYIISYLQDFKVRERYKKFNVDPYKGILLYGPPGTGKTALARALAHDNNVPFVSYKISDIVSPLDGASEIKIAAIFKEAKEAAQKSPAKVAILFFDEIDAIGGDRSANDRSPWRTSRLNALLAEMDGFEKNSNVLVFAATNRPDMLDPAIKRPGRFDTMIEIGLPDAKKQNEILDLYLSKIPYEHAKNKKQRDVLVETISEKFKAHNIQPSPAILKGIVHEATRQAVHDVRVDTVKDSMIVDAVDKHIANALKESRSSVVQPVAKPTDLKHLGNQSFKKWYSRMQFARMNQPHHLHKLGL